jgi:DNA-binding NarL/FixJ family response regulator
MLGNWNATTKAARSQDLMSTRILIADDSPTLRGRLRKILEKRAGWEVCAEAETGEIAVAKTVTFRPNVIVLDLFLPDMDGLQAALEIGAALGSMPNIVIYTLDTLPALGAHARKIGVREVVSKSDIGALIEAIEKLSADVSGVPVGSAKLAAAQPRVEAA